MKLLAVDTATEACSAALWLDGAVAERYEVAPRRHTELILPMCEALLDEAGLTLAALDAIAFGRGPGAFTGVRVAAGIAQGVALGANLPVVPVSSLAALAQGAVRERGAERIIAAFDARLGEVYWAAYRHVGDELRQVIDETVCRPQDVPLPPGHAWLGVGTGFETYPQVLSRRLGDALRDYVAERYPRARDIAELGARAYAAGETVAAEDAVPVYVRDFVADRPGRSPQR